MRDADGRELLRLPADPSPVKLKRHWTALFFADPAGYLPDGSPVTAVSVGYPPNEVLPFGPGWVRSWWFFFLSVTTAAALAVKFAFRIS